MDDNRYLQKVSIHSWAQRNELTGFPLNAGDAGLAD